MLIIIPESENQSLELKGKKEKPLRANSWPGSLRGWGRITKGLPKDLFPVEIKGEEK
jgi:hypothetical protein